MKIQVYKNRGIYKLYGIDKEGTQNENESTILELEFEEELEKQYTNKRIVFITPNGNLWDYIQDNKYIIKNGITKYEEVEAYIWLTDDNKKDFRTRNFTLNFYCNENADDLQPSEEEIDGFNTLITTLNLKIEEVKQLEENLIELDKTLQENEKARDEKVNKAIENISDLTEEYNINAENKTSDFNLNAIQKTEEFNTNAKEKTDSLNNIADDIKDMANALFFATFDIDVDTGELYVNTADSLGNMGFEVNDEGDLLVEIK